jgi:hypothetical protein
MNEDEETSAVKDVTQVPRRAFSLVVEQLVSSKFKTSPSNCPYLYSTGLEERGADLENTLRVPHGLRLRTLRCHVSSPSVAIGDGFRSLLGRLPSKLNDAIC